MRRVKKRQRSDSKVKKFTKNEFTQCFLTTTLAIFLGLCYSAGTGVTTNSYEAVKWYKKAAEQGVAGAQYYLGICYLEGDGVRKNRPEAMRLFQKAAEQGHEDAKKALQHIEQQMNQNSNNNNNLSGNESTIIDRSGHETTVTSQPNSSSTTNSSTSQSEGSEKWYIIWCIILGVLTFVGIFTEHWLLCAIGGVGLFVSGWVKTLFFDK